MKNFIYAIIAAIGCISCTTKSIQDNWGDELTRYVVESYMPAEKYVWNWNEAVFLKAVVVRCENGFHKEYLLPYIKQCVDATIEKANGHNPNTVVAGLAAAYLAQETGDSTYRNLAERIYTESLNIPKTSNGGISHRVDEIELWDDTVYMMAQFYIQMYKLTDDYTYLKTAADQLLLHAEKLEDPTTGLWFHGWDNDTIPSKDPYCQPGWAKTPNRCNSEFWGRGNGWIVMTLTDLLELISPDESRRPLLESSLKDKLATLMSLQDKITGHWFQLPMYPHENGNFIESTCTAMFAYSAAKASLLGIIPPGQYDSQIRLAYSGLRKYSLKQEGEYLKMDNVCGGTCVGDKSYYYGRDIVQERAYAFGIAIMFYDLYQQLFPNG